MKECPNCHELLGDNVDVCFKCHYDFKSQKILTQEERLELREKEAFKTEQLSIERKINEAQKEALRKEREEAIKNAVQPEYKSVVITNNFLSTEMLNEILEKEAVDGWCLFSTTPLTQGSFGSSIVGSISTQLVLIFERRI